MYLRILVHNNEHKGQFIAYARVDRIVPPWVPPRIRPAAALNPLTRRAVLQSNSPAGGARMAAAHTAILTHEGEDTLIRIPGHIALPEGPLLVREGAQEAELIFSVPQPADPVPTFAEFVALRDSFEKDEHWTGFMKDRPHNKPRSKPYPFR